MRKELDDAFRNLKNKLRVLNPNNQGIDKDLVERHGKIEDQTSMLHNIKHLSEDTEKTMYKVKHKLVNQTGQLNRIEDKQGDIGDNLDQAKNTAHKVAQASIWTKYML
eukprot:CAMPEP_0116929596 /NCGR_PEP_ID=MMETSP0467-20121206/26673_1 /TAXON_ID=283647 /ORGANISM="Mesodinium pulex, Strain SPMC105" /LENGTH=107 /DNA_ID=CAMNT_0004609591 /DNA_START=206 /DNA_END=529 /DNA_ORIENTATION=+